MRNDFTSDYTEGACPEILHRLCEINLDKNTAYGLDAYSVSAAEKIRVACKCPKAGVYFLIGGTQANSTVLSALLASYEGVIAANTGHISVHEAGAVEYSGHKVITVEGKDGKIDAETLNTYMQSFLADSTHDHIVQPGAVYISHPSEYGTLYTRKELLQLKELCKKYSLKLYMDGARLGYALASEYTDVDLPFIASVCDAFYIGGTKVGALFGEAVVIPNEEYTKHFFTITKQHGALLAKGWIAGIQFDTLFTNGLYMKISENADRMAAKLRKGLEERGYTFISQTPTNQVFVVITNKQAKELKDKIGFSVWEKHGEDGVLIRLATSWATTEQQVNDLLKEF